MSHDNITSKRRNLDFHVPSIKEVLPEHFHTNYPDLVKFIEAYYKFLDADDAHNFDHLINSIDTSRDIEDATLGQLNLLFKEIGANIVNTNYFKDPRYVARLLSNFYRVKGSTYSAEGFFKAFYGIDAEITYPKRTVFTIDESLIGPEDLALIQDGALYQVLSILVKSELPISVWGDLYKKFVHPAGFYLGSEVSFTGSADMMQNPMPFVYKAADLAKSIVDLASTTILGSGDYTMLTIPDTWYSLNYAVDQAWEYGSYPYSPWFRSSAVDNDGNVYVGDLYSGLLLKYDKNGELVWERSYLSNYQLENSDLAYVSQWTMLTNVSCDLDGNPILTMLHLWRTLGSPSQYIYDDSCTHISKVSSTDGSVLWTITIDASTDSDIGYFEGSPETRVVVSPAGNKYIATPTTIERRAASPAPMSEWIKQNILVVKFDSNNDVVWKKEVGATGVFDIPGIFTGLNDPIITVDNNDNTIVLADRWAYDRYQPYFIKLDANGNAVWQKTGPVAGEKGYYPSSVTTDSIGNCYVLLRANYYTSEPDRNSMLIKLSPSGSVIWKKIIGDVVTVDRGLEACGLALDGQDYVYLVCNISFTEEAKRHIAIMKISPSGTIEWSREFLPNSGRTGFSYPQPYSISVKNNYVYIAVEYNFNDAYYDANREASLVIKIKNDGTGIGNFGDFSYMPVDIAISNASATIEDFSYNIITSTIPVTQTTGSVYPVSSEYIRSSLIPME